MAGLEVVEGAEVEVDSEVVAGGVVVGVVEGLEGSEVDGAGLVLELGAVVGCCSDVVEGASVDSVDEVGSAEVSLFTDEVGAAAAEEATWLVALLSRLKTFKTLAMASSSS